MSEVKKINLSRLKKCNQYWEDMSENERGRLCLKCNHTIIDFRDKTDAEIAKAHFLSEGKLCGLYTKNQLKISKRSSFGFKHKFKMLYLGLFGLFSFNSFGQETIEAVKTEQTEQKYVSEKIPSQEKIVQKRFDLKDSIFISGKLNDKEGVVPGACVGIKGTENCVLSNIDGFYSLNVTNALDSLGEVTLVYRFVGSKTVFKTINTEYVKKNRTINVQFEWADDLITEYYVVYRPPWYKRIWYRIKKIFKRRN